MVEMDRIGPIWLPCKVTEWRYILVVVDYFSRLSEQEGIKMRIKNQLIILF